MGNRLEGPPHPKLQSIPGLVFLREPFKLCRVPIATFMRPLPRPQWQPPWWLVAGGASIGAEQGCRSEGIAGANRCMEDRHMVVIASHGDTVVMGSMSE